jgi:hypothetical protein
MVPDETLAVIIPCDVDAVSEVNGSRLIRRIVVIAIFQNMHREKEKSQQDRMGDGRLVGILGSENWS